MDNGIQMDQPGRDRSTGDSPGQRPAVRGRPWSARGWAARAIGAIAIALLLLSAGGVALAYYGTDDNLVVGYAPVQPVEFSHKLHAGDLMLDCRFCHTTSERGPMAGFPSTRLCMNCHAQILPESVKLLPVRATFAENRPIAWVRVTKLPEFTYFDHSVHSVAGIGCSSCHGRVDLMLRTEQAVSLSMGFCLGCHRDPAPFIRDVADITNMAWLPKSPPSAVAMSLSASTPKPTPPLHCSGCHR